MHAGERYAQVQVDALDDDAFAGPSRLPDWSRAHLVTHLARNADALVNLLTWAETGVETPMYPSLEARGRDIEEGSRRSPAVLREDLRACADRLGDAIAAMPEAAWEHEVQTRHGRVIRATGVAWIRAREVWVHAVDLGGIATFADLPHAFATAVVDDAAATMTADPACPAVELRADDGAQVWRIGRSDAVPASVTGAIADLVGWVLGRSDGAALRAEGGRLPDLPPWG
jgi:maleylpyruvate isomerase